jgi:3-hydroxyacyl-CoA dehydrogenase
MVITVVGAGVMGRGIARLFARAGLAGPTASNTFEIAQ